MELPKWAEDLIEITPTIHIRPALLRRGSYVHLIKNDIPQESFYVDVIPREITEEKLKQMGYL